MPCATRCSTPSLGVTSSPSSSATEFTVYPDVRAANSTARRVLAGPYETAPSTSTPIRRLRRLARVRAA